MFALDIMIDYMKLPDLKQTISSAIPMVCSVGLYDEKKFCFTGKMSF